MSNEIKIRDLPDFEAAANLVANDFLYLIKDNTFLDKKLKISDLYAYMLGLINTQSFNATADARIDVYAANRFLSRNALINGDFRFWQRNNGTISANGTITVKTADRWDFTADGTGSTRTISRQTFAPGELEGVGLNSSNYLRIDQPVGGSGATFNTIRQFIEGVRTYAGQKVTLSFYARSSTGVTSITGNIRQFFGTGGSPSTQIATNYTINGITSSWQKLSTTVQLPSITGKALGTNGDDALIVHLVLPVNTALNLDIAYVQLEVGDKATSYEFRSNQIELSLCQRYYEKSYDLRDIPGTITFAGNTFGYCSINFSNGQSMNIATPFKVVKRVLPAISIYSCTTGATGKMTVNGADASITNGNISLSNTGNISNNSGSTILSGSSYNFQWVADSDF